MVGVAPLARRRDPHRSAYPGRQVPPGARPRPRTVRRQLTAAPTTPPTNAATEAAAAARDERTEMVPVGGLQLRVSIRPAVGFSSAATRPPLLLCNGIGAPIEMWTPFRDPLGRPTIAFDAPGVGESSVPLIPPTIGGVAQLMMQVLDHLGVPTVDVLGVSWGGAPAPEIPPHRGERGRRLVACAPMARGPPHPPAPPPPALP